MILNPQVLAMLLALLPGIVRSEEMMTGHCEYCKAFISRSSKEFEIRRNLIIDLQKQIDEKSNKSALRQSDPTEIVLDTLKRNMTKIQDRIIALNYTIAELRLTHAMKTREFDELQARLTADDAEYEVQDVRNKRSMEECKDKLIRLTTQSRLVKSLNELVSSKVSMLSSILTMCDGIKVELNKKALSVATGLLNRMFSLFETSITKGHDTILQQISANEEFESDAVVSDWLVILKRQTNSEDLNRSWGEYIEGFGDKNNGFWYGLEKLHQLTKDKRYDLMIEVIDRNKVKHNVIYDDFRVGNNASNYKLESVGGYTGSIGDILTSQVGQVFSTSDKVNAPPGQCPRMYRSGWWYSDCDQTNLTGNKLQCASDILSKARNCLLWRHLDGSLYPLKQLELSIRLHK